MYEGPLQRSCGAASQPSVKVSNGPVVSLDTRGGKQTFAAGFADVCYARVVSTGCCNTRLKFLCWGLILQGLSRPLVELASVCAQLCLAKARYINAFREVLAKKSIGVFITPSLPRIARQAIA